MNRRKLLIMAMAIIGAITQSSTLCMAAESNQCVRYCEVDAKEVVSDFS